MQDGDPDRGIGHYGLALGKLPSPHTGIEADERQTAHSDFARQTCNNACQGLQRPPCGAANFAGILLTDYRPDRPGNQ